jgi:CBS-domain-containing membrane protein
MVEIDHVSTPTFATAPYAPERPTTGGRPHTTFTRRTVPAPMEARDVMTTDVETVQVDDEVSEVLTRLAEADFSGFPVLDDEGRLAGIVTEHDLVDIFQPSDRTLWIPIGFPPFLETVTYGIDVSWDDLDVGVDLARNASKEVGEVMTTDVVTVGPDDDLGTLVALLGDPERGINRLPVVDDDGWLVGVVSRQDVLAALRGVDLAFEAGGA